MTTAGFKALSDAHLRVVSGGIRAGIMAHTKDGGSPDPPKASDGTPLPSPTAMGDEIPGERPSLTIEHVCLTPGCGPR